MVVAGRQEKVVMRKEYKVHLLQVGCYHNLGGGVASLSELESGNPQISLSCNLMKTKNYEMNKV